MLRLLKFLILGDWHLHKWNDVKDIKLHNKYDNYAAHIYIVKCEHCGKVKSFKQEF